MFGNGENITYNMVDEFCRAPFIKRNVFSVWLNTKIGISGKKISLLDKSLLGSPLYVFLCLNGKFSTESKQNKIVIIYLSNISKKKKLRYKI